MTDSVDIAVGIINGTGSATSSPQNGSPKQNRLLGQPLWMTTESYSLVLLLISALSYSFMSCFIKLSVHRGMQSNQLVFVRAVVQGTLIVSAMSCFFFEQDGEDDTADSDGRKKRRPLIWQPMGPPSIRQIVIARGIVGGLGFLMYYYAVSALPIGDATALLSLNPVLTVLAAAIILNEPLRWSHGYAATASLVGSILLARPTFLFGQANSDDADDIVSRPIWGYVAALTGTCCSSTVYILIRKAGKGAHTLHLVFSWCFFGMLYSLLGRIFRFLVASPSHITGDSTIPSVQWSLSLVVFVTAMCIFGTGGHILMNFAGRHAPAGLSALMRSSGILWSYMLEVLVFGQVPNPLTRMGVVLILSALASIAWDKHRQEMAKMVAPVVSESVALKSVLPSEQQPLAKNYGTLDRA